MSGTTLASLTHLWSKVAIHVTYNNNFPIVSTCFNYYFKTVKIFMKTVNLAINILQVENNRVFGRHTSQTMVEIISTSLPLMIIVSSLLIC